MSKLHGVVLSDDEAKKLREVSATLQIPSAAVLRVGLGRILKKPPTQREVRECVRKPGRPRRDS